MEKPTRLKAMLDADLPLNDRMIYNILKEESPEDSPSPVNTYVPPTDAEVEAGIMNRYFVARYDSKSASEVSGKWLKDNGDSLPEGIYNTIKIRWYLRDGINIENRKVLHQITAALLNESTIDISSKEMPQLQHTIKDFAKFVG